MNRCILTLGILVISFFSANYALADNVNWADYPLVAQISFVQQTGDINKCSSEASVAISEITDGSDTRIIGSNFYPMVQGNSCLVQTFLMSKKPITKSNAEQILTKNNFALDTWVTNERGTFYGLNATVQSGEKNFDCTRKNPKNISVSNWFLGSPALENEIENLSRSDVSTKKNWLKKHFDCGTFDSYTHLQLYYDVTNEEQCPLSISNLHSCFLFRGLHMVNISLEN